MSKKQQDNVKELIKQKRLRLVKDKLGLRYCMIDNDVYLLYADELNIAMRKFYYKEFGVLISMQDSQSICEMLEILIDSVEDIEICKRIYYNGNQYAYELDRDDGTVVWIEDGEISIEKTEGILFRHSTNYASQVMPDFDVKPKF